MCSTLIFVQLICRHSPLWPESIEWFIEDEAFSTSCMIKAPPPPPPLSPVTKLSLFRSLPCASPVEHSDGRVGEVVRGEPDNKTTRKPNLYESFNTLCLWPSVNFCCRYLKVGYDSPFKWWNRRNEVWYTVLHWLSSSSTVPERYLS